jgi:hypothetical protein
MIPIPGFLIALATFPGVIIHEVAHQLFCRIAGVPVYEVRYFQVNLHTAGYVIHAPPKSFGAAFLISVGPLILNTLVCLAICFPAAIPYRVFSDRGPLTYVLLWLGISIGMHAFPSTVDAQAIWASARAAVARRNVFAVLAFPFVVLVYIANVLRVIWFDAIYGFVVGVLAPAWILGAL